MTKGALILSLSFLLAACSSIRKISKAITNLIFKKVLLLFKPAGVICWSTSALWWEGYQRINGKTDTLLEIAVLPLDSYASLILKPTIRAGCSPDKAAS